MLTALPPAVHPLLPECLHRHSLQLPVNLCHLALVALRRREHLARLGSQVEIRRPRGTDDQGVDVRLIQRPERVEGDRVEVAAGVLELCWQQRSASEPTAW